VKKQDKPRVLIIVAQNNYAPFAKNRREMVVWGQFALRRPLVELFATSTAFAYSVHQKLLSNF
jgi:hypothetical protein